MCLPIRCLEIGYSIVACVCIAAGMFLANRCLAMDYSGFQASCHNMLKNSYAINITGKIIYKNVSTQRLQSVCIYECNTTQLLRLNVF
jgi:hypothetical protein